MADVKDITIRYGVDPGNSTKAMNDIAKASAVAGGALDKTGMSMKTNTQLGMNFNRVLQDSPYFFSSFNMGVMSVANNLPMLAESFQAARMRGESFKQMLSGMFMGMGGWMTALNLAISGILAYTMYTRDATKETDKFEESQRRLEAAFNSMVKIENPFMKMFSLDTSNIKDIDKLIDKLRILTGETQALQAKSLPGQSIDIQNAEEANKLRAEAFTKMVSASGQYSEGVKKRLEDLKTELEFQKELSRILEEIGMKSKEGGKGGGGKSPKTPKIDIGMGNSKEWAELEAFGDKYREKQAESEAKLAQQKRTAIDNYYNTVKFADEDYYNYRRTKLNEELLGLQELGIAEEDLDILRKQRLDELESEKMASLRRIHQFENNFANAASATLRTGMNQAFDDIFGHANSLLEIFLQNLMSGMAQDFATSAGEGIFSWLTGGASDIFSWIGLSKGDSRGDDSKQVINVNIDSQKVAQIAVKPYLKESVYELNRTGRW